ncbi:MAG: hypothetical protein ABFD82_13400 [Syntrophaceae bacterium]
MNYPAAISRVSEVMPDLISLPRIPTFVRTGPIRGYPTINGLVPHRILSSIYLSGTGTMSGYRLEFTPYFDLWPV